MINFFDYSASYKDIKDELVCEIEKIIDSAVFINGESVNRFEIILSEYIKSKYSLGLSSGTDSLLVAIMASVKKKKGNFIIPSFTFTATAMSPLRLGYDIKFVDTDKNFFKPSIQSVIELIDKDTVGVIWPYLFGEPTDISELYIYCKDNNVVLIEDCAQSMGTTIKGKHVGNFSDVSCFSFFPTKNLGCFGDGGAMITSNKEINEKAKKIKSHGYYEQKYNSSIVGGNFRLDTIQAVVLIELFKKIDILLSLRHDNAKFYNNHIFNEKVIKPEFITGHSWNQYSLIVDCNKKFKRYMHKNNIQTNVYYPVPLHKNKVFNTCVELKNTEKLCNHIVSIPIYPGLSKQHLNRITEAVNKYDQ